MPFQEIFTNPIGFIVWGAIVTISLSIHEFAHAFTADKLGDPTPRLQGRVTLNPLAHLDPLGTLAILFIGFGWGKPVMFDPYNLKDPKRDAALIAVAGPLSNIAIALLCAILYHVSPLGSFIPGLLYGIIALNLGLAFFNLIPIHPLDGGKILIGLAPHDVARDWDRVLHQYGTVILLFMILPLNGQSAVSALISPIVSTALKFLIG